MGMGRGPVRSVRDWGSPWPLTAFASDERPRDLPSGPLTPVEGSRRLGSMARPQGWPRPGGSPVGSLSTRRGPGPSSPAFGRSTCANIARATEAPRPRRPSGRGGSGAEAPRGPSSDDTLRTMPSCPDGCRPEVLEAMRWRASRPYAVRHAKPDPVRAELRRNMIYLLRGRQRVYRSGDVIPITAHPRFRCR